MTASPTERLDPTEQFYADIERDAKAINDAAYEGDSTAMMIVKAHRMHVSRPDDPGALGICMAAYSEWQKRHPR